MEYHGVLGYIQRASFKEQISNYGFVLEYYGKNNGVWNWDMQTVLYDYHGAYYVTNILVDYNACNCFFIKNGSHCDYNEGLHLETRNWHKYSIIVKPHKQEIYIDDKPFVKKSWKCYNLVGSIFKSFRLSPKGGGSYDWIRVRKYADQEPIVTIKENKPIVKVIIGVNDRNFMSDEVERLKQYLKETGITPQIFYTNDHLDWIYFRDCDLIIYHNMGWDWNDYKNGKSPKIYEILEKAKNSGIPILVLGDDPTWNADDYWVSKILHLHSAEDNGDFSGGKVEIIDSNSPIINGKYGKVQDFTYIGDMDVICRYGKGKVLAVHKLGAKSKVANVTCPISTSTTSKPIKVESLCTQTPVVFYYINKSPIVVINLNLYIKDQNGNVVGQISDLKMIETLFKNSVDYLLNWRKPKQIITEFIYTPQCPTIGQTITFDASLSYSSNKIVSYEWDFGDGTTAEGKIVYHKYDEEGKYTVKLTIKDERGLTATKEKVITVLNSSKPVIIRVQPKIGGIVIKGISFENTYTAYVKSKTPIDRVIFKLNGKVVYVDTNGSDGWSARINTNLFDNDSILEVIAIDKNGIKSDPYTLKIRVIGIPEWLNWFIKYGNVSVSSDGTITFEKFIPDPPIDASVRIPKSIPVIGGEQKFKAQSRFAIIYEMPTQTAVVAGVGIIKIKILDRETEGRIGTEGTIEVPSFKLKGARVWGYIEIEVFSQTWNIADIPIVGEIKFDVGVSPHVKVEANITAEESVKLKDGSIYPGMKAEGEAKFDFKVAKVEIGGEGDATSKIHIPAPYDPSVTAEVSAYGVVKAGIFEADISVGPYKYRYPESSAKVLKIPKEYVRVSEWRLVKKYGGIPAYKVGIKSLVNVMTVQPLAQTEYGRVTINNVEDENPSVIYINNSSYLMVWSAQDPEKDVKSGHDLYYVIYTPSVGWSEIKKLTSDYFDDRNPVLAKLGSKVVCVWTVVNKDLRKENVTSPYDVFPYVEIAYSVYNGTWSKPVIITNNSEFEYNLNIYCNNNETCIIAWEVDKDLNFSTSDKVVKLALLNTTTSEFRIIREISDATKPTLAGNYIAYFDPVDNKLVFGSIKPFKVITSYNCLDLMDIDLSCYNDNCTLVWIDNFDIFYANPPNNAVKLDCNCSAYTIDVEDFETYKLLVFSGKAPGDVKQRIFYMVGYNNSWVEKRTLAGGTNLTFWQVNYAYDSSGFFAVFAGKEKLDDKNDIFYVYHKYAGDLEIYANISGSYTINDNVIVNYTVRNVGDQPVSDFTVEIYNLNMEKLASKDFDGLDVGAIVNDSFNVKLDESGGFVIKVLATPDLDMSNNIVKLVLLHPDLTVKELKESRINDKLIINVSFENLGSVDANNVTFKLLNGNRTLYSGVIDLQAGCSTNYTITINITDIDRNLTSCIVIDSEDKILEEREDNNILYFRTLMTDLSIGTVKAIDNGSGVRLKVLVGNYGLGDSTANLTVLDENLTPIKYITFTINGSNIPIFKEITLVLSYDEWNKAKYVCVEDRYDKNFGNNIAEVEKRLLKMPIAEFTHEPSTLRLFAGKLILFKSTSYDLDGNITLYIWNFGDGNVIVTNSSMIEHKYDNIGNYTVTLTVVDDDGLTNSTSKKIVVVRAGDFNGDGEVDIGDVVYVAYIVIGKLPQDLRADFNDNGRVDIGDLAKIAYYLIGKINEL